jgi:hypothetical protein
MVTSPKDLFPTTIRLDCTQIIRVCGYSACNRILEFDRIFISKVPQMMSVEHKRNRSGSGFPFVTQRCQIALAGIGPLEMIPILTLPDGACPNIAILNVIFLFPMPSVLSLRG